MFYNRNVLKIHGRVLWLVWIIIRPTIRMLQYFPTIISPCENIRIALYAPEIDDELRIILSLWFFNFIYVFILVPSVVIAHTPLYTAERSIKKYIIIIRDMRPSHLHARPTQKWYTIWRNKFIRYKNCNKSLLHEIGRGSNVP